MVGEKNGALSGRIRADLDPTKGNSWDFGLFRRGAVSARSGARRLGRGHSSGLGWVA